MGNLKDLSGMRFGHWTVIERDYEIKKKNIYWKCRCDCGTVRSVAGTSLRSGISVSCGCEKDKKTSIRTKANVEDIVGQRFGHWLVLKQDLSDDSTSKRGARWICRCDCGKEKSVLGYALRFGRSTSCGCSNSSSKIIDLTGQRFGKLTVLRRDSISTNDHKGARWICKCDCGNEISVLSGRLRSGQTKSCGCLRYDKKDYKKSDLIGQVFGRWTVQEKDTARKGHGTFYICKCECGNIRSISSDSLTRGTSKSCGCGRGIPKTDLTGQRFGKLTVLGLDDDKSKKSINWICRCDCGTIKSYRTHHLLRDNVISCGCESRRMSSERNFIDITGDRFGRLMAVKIDHRELDSCGNSDYFWECRCDCGNTIVVQGSVLRRGDTKSCGCLQSEESAKRAKTRVIDMVGKRFGLLTVVERVSVSDDNGFEKWRCICDCGNEKLADGYYLRKGMIASCGCLKQSKYEVFVLKYFEEMGYESPIDYEYQKRFEDLRGYGEGMLSYDFAVYKNEKLFALIECQGQQHYKPVEMFGGEEQFAKQQLHDEIKRDYAEQLGVPLIEVPFTVVTYEETKAILESAGI
ncbi:MAG: hypothetical protein U0L02_09745 [Kandleria vitulina]|uniref:hypothetical protein n=1 Tax=Kandleria vitulina TaxID=1630 RepID=UPI002E767F88|nr:hypothetical protein [Kandleria vitulina]MEE0989629.1 hypothetical protein [Kandleria vitulina]